MKILITGGAGFIGSHLAEQLINNGCKVTVIDNLSTGCLENIAGLKDKAGFKFIKGNICDASLISRIIEYCDEIYHLAAAVGVQLIADNPVRTIETNISGTQVVLEAANKYRKKILLASSSEVYGKSESAPFSEDDDLVLGSTSMPRWAYACSKAVDEFLGFAFHQEYALKVVIARFFNTIGPRQTGRYGMVVPRFIKSALCNEPLQIYGTGKQTRCFCYVEDVVEAITGLMNCPQAAGMAFNIGSSEEVSIEQLADKIIETTSSKSKKQYVAYEVAYGRFIEDMMRRAPCLDRIKNTIGWIPKTNLNTTLRLIAEKSRNEKH